MYSFITSDSTQYGLGFLSTQVAGFLTGLDLFDTTVLAILVPGVILAVAAIPKFLKESLLLYRAYYRTEEDDDTERDQ